MIRALNGLRLHPAVDEFECGIARYNMGEPLLPHWTLGFYDAVCRAVVDVRTLLVGSSFWAVLRLLGATRTLDLIHRGQDGTLVKASGMGVKVYDPMDDTCPDRRFDALVSHDLVYGCQAVTTIESVREVARYVSDDGTAYLALPMTEDPERMDEALRLAFGDVQWWVEDPDGGARSTEDGQPPRHWRPAWAVCADVRGR
jgi:hypothetical protein